MLSPDGVKAFYDKFGARQDAQAFYEDPATNLLIERAGFESARSVFELGVGTGRFAEKLLTACLPAECRYSGVDVSSTMVDLAEQRLCKYAGRVHLSVATGSPAIPEENGSVDRFISTYVFDLLSEEDGRTLVEEAHRVLRPNGLLCVVSLTAGTAVHTRLVSMMWQAVYRISPGLVGGCRPIRFSDYLAGRRWDTRLDEKVAAFGITSEVVIAGKAV